MQLPEIQDQTGRNAKIDEISETVEFGAEFRLAFDHACDPAVEAIEHGGEHDRAHRQFHPPFRRQADRRQARADRKQGYEIGHQHPYRDRTKPTAAHFRVFGIKGHRHGCAIYSKPQLVPPLRRSAAGFHNPDG